MEFNKQITKLKKKKPKNHVYANQRDSLYLHNRKLPQLPPLLQITKFNNVIKLFLQNNSLKNLKGLNMLPLLKILNVSYNNLSVIADLNHCHRLEYVDVQKQIIAGNQTVRFDPRTSETLKKCLIELNCAGNNLEEIGNITILKNIQSLNLSDNRINNLTILTKDLLNFPNLIKLNLTKNKISKEKSYIRNILGIGAISGPQIEELDNHKVLPEIRQHYINVYKTVFSERPKNDFFFNYIGERCGTLSAGVKEGIQQNVITNEKLIQLMNSDFVT